LPSFVELAAILAGKFLGAVQGLPPGKGLAIIRDGRRFSDDGEVFAEWIQGFITAFNAMPEVDEAHQVYVDYAGTSLWIMK
jgi:hypothetical protein